MQLERYEMNNDIERIPYIAYESALARNERTIKRLIIALLLSIVLMFASNGIWIYAFSQFEYVDETTTTTVQQDGKGQNVYGDNNKLSNGAKDSNSQTKKNDKEKER